MISHSRRTQRGALLSLAFCLSSVAALGAGSPGGRRVSGGVPTPFQISPVRSANFRTSGAFLNPRSKLLVVFFWEDGASRQRLLSRRFDGSGNPVGGTHIILEIPAKSMSRMVVVYSATDDRYLLAGADYDSDCVKGLLLDGNGRSLNPGRAGGEGDLVIIKPETKRGSVQNLTLGWIPALNRYLVVWTYSNWASRSDPVNGHYLTVLDGSLKTIQKTRQVRSQPMRRKTYGIRTLIPLQDRILWGSGEDAPNYRAGSRPVVWFTDFRGNVLTSCAPATGGFINPGGTVPDEYGVLAAHNPKAGLFLLHWHVIGSLATSEAESAETQFRIMDERGRFKSSLKIAPKTQLFQYRSLSGYLASQDRFFLACLEYKNWDKAAGYFWGGKLLGFYVNNRGGIEDKAGRPSASPVTLLSYVNDLSGHVNFEALVPEVPDATLFAGYSIVKKKSPQQSLWGLLLD